MGFDNDNSSENSSISNPMDRNVENDSTTTEVVKIKGKQDENGFVDEYGIIHLRSHKIYPRKLPEYLCQLVPDKMYNVGQFQYPGSNFDYIHFIVSSTFGESDDLRLDIINQYLDLFPEKVDLPSEQGKHTPLMIACAHYNLSTLDIIRTLIERGADVNAVDEYGATPLLYAYVIYFYKNVNHKIKTKTSELILFLLEKGADPCHELERINIKKIFSSFYMINTKYNLYEIYVKMIGIIGNDYDKEIIDNFISKIPQLNRKFNDTYFFDTINNKKLIDYINSKILETESKSSNPPSILEEQGFSQKEDILKKIVELLDLYKKTN